METFEMLETSRKKFMQSLTFKGMTVAALILVLLIPGAMIQSLIKERQTRSRETILKINEKWSSSQRLIAPILMIPYTAPTLDKNNVPRDIEHTLFITPKELKINASLTPEERYYGIYKAILYKSELHFEGYFEGLADFEFENRNLHFDKAQIVIGITDLKGVTQNPNFKINGQTLETTVGSVNIPGRALVVNLRSLHLTDSSSQPLHFEFATKLNGSSSLNFIPVGQHTAVTLNGEWSSPSFIGAFSPESTVDAKQFSATWSILSYNRDIPKMQSNRLADDIPSTSFGVNLIETVDHYQQNMRSAKYALMFIALTFIVFFFAEVFTKKRVQFFQYVLVGIALILFYSLLLSLSEQFGFGIAYLIASAATVSMVTVYFHSLIRQKLATFILAGTMSILYAFLYVILQIEDFTLLSGSIFLFVVLGVIMFVSNKIKLPVNKE